MKIQKKFMYYKLYKEIVRFIPKLCIPFMSCPQNIEIPGFSSARFHVVCDWKIKDPDHETTFIESILSDLMDSLGDDFNLTILREESFKTVFNIIYPYKMWLTDFAIKIAAFQNLIGNDVIYSPMRVSITLHNDFEIDRVKTTYTLIAKNGIYIEKKKTNIIRTLKTLVGGFCDGSVIPEYAFNIVDF